MKTIEKALIIDDDETIREMLTKLCERFDIHADAVYSLRDVHAIFNGNDQPYDLFFVDLILPEMNGWDILGLIRDTPATKDKTAVVLSGAVCSQEEKEKLLRKADFVLDKQTFSVAKFKDILQKCQEEQG